MSIAWKFSRILKVIFFYAVTILEWFFLTNAKFLILIYDSMCLFFFYFCGCFLYCVCIIVFLMQLFPLAACDICCRWYHGKVSREEAESLLAGHMIGSFLVRENGHYPGDYTLSLVIPGDVVEHYRVLQTNNKVEVDGGDLQFDTLLELVEVYFSLEIVPFIGGTSILSIRAASVSQHSFFSSFFFVFLY